MSNDHNISYSFQMGSKTDPVKEKPLPIDTNLFAFGQCEVLDLPDGNVLLVSTSSGKQLSVTRDVSIALRHCQAYRSLNGHAKFLASYMPELGGNELDVEKVLTFVKDAGLLTSATDVCERINKECDSTAEVAPTHVCIITCDRPTAVERLLESMLQGAKLTQHKKLYLVDDSRDPEIAIRNLSAVESFNLSSPVNMSYVGEAQQLQLLGELIATIPEHESAIRFLIDRNKWRDFKSYGLARTLCLLLSVGQRCLIMDDDVICSALDSPHRKTGIKFADGMRDADFYSTVQDWQQNSVPAIADPLAGHAKCLGMSLSPALKALGVEKLSQQDLTDVDIGSLKQAHAESPVLITQSGSMGDPGTGDNGWLAGLNSDSLDRLLESPGGLQSAFTNRQYWLGRTTPTFSKKASMSQITGLDNSRVLPPYFPVFRGEDLIFGNMVNFLFPDSLTLEYDWAVPHLPMDERKANSEGDSTNITGNMDLASEYIASKCPPDPAISFEHRLEALSLVLFEVSENSSEGITAMFHAELARARVNNLRFLSDALRKSTNRRDDWTAYLRRCVAENVETLQSSSALQNIAAIPNGMDDKLIIRQIKDFTRDYAMALRAWPAIRDAAADIVKKLSL